MTADSAPTGKPLTPERLAQIREWALHGTTNDGAPSIVLDLLVELDRRVSPALSAETIREAHKLTLSWDHLTTNYKRMAELLTTHLRTQAPQEETKT